MIHTITWAEFQVIDSEIYNAWMAHKCEIYLNAGRLSRIVDDNEAKFANDHKSKLTNVRMLPTDILDIRWLRTQPDHTLQPLDELASLREQVAALTAELEAAREEIANLEVAVNRSDLDVHDMKQVLHVPRIKQAWESLYDQYEQGDENCPLCGSADDEPHEHDCTMLTIIALVDGNYD